MHVVKRLHEAIEGMIRKNLEGMVPDTHTEIGIMPYLYHSELYSEKEKDITMRN